MKTNYLRLGIHFIVGGFFLANALCTPFLVTAEGLDPHAEGMINHAIFLDENLPNQVRLYQAQVRIRSQDTSLATPQVSPTPQHSQIKPISPQNSGQIAVPKQFQVQSASPQNSGQIEVTTGQNDIPVKNNCSIHGIFANLHRYLLALFWHKNCTQ